jgi:thiol-disulfide isomerase/thioredoxin
MENIYVIAIILVILLLFYYLFYYNVIKVYMFYSDNCGYCKEMKPQWESTKEKINGEMMGIGYKLYDIDMSDSMNKELISKYKVTGVPHIVKVNIADKSEVYTGPRKFKEIKDWIQSK